MGFSKKLVLIILTVLFYLSINQNKIQAVTVTQGATSINLTVLLHGIGRGGDNVNPGSLGNNNPFHPQRTVSVELFDSQNLSLGIKQGTVNFNSISGNFQGSIDVGPLSTGLYTAKVRSPQYLTRQLPGILSITSGQLNTIPQTVLIAGDSNNDNKLTILDFNLILDCFSELNPPRNCSDANKKLSSDLTDDGYVNQFDYNLFLRELSVQGGDGGGSTPTPISGLTATSTPPLSPPIGDRIVYAPSTEDFANPERGFMRSFNIAVDQTYTGKINKKDLQDTLAWIYFDLRNYRDSRDGKGVTVSNYQFKSIEAIGSNKGLDTIQKTFQDARSKGLKLVIRFMYVGHSGIGSTSDFPNAEPDAPLSVALQHINQLAPLINQNKDVVAVVQAGMVGYWGEWHSSKYLSPIASRKAITDEWLKVLDKNLMLQVRYPKYVQNFYGGPVTSALAFNQSNLSRIGFHNDAVFKDAFDDGTFTSNAMGMKISTYCDASADQTACWRDYYSKTSTYTPSGGEAGTHSSTASVEANCTNAVPEMARLHFSFLHNEYSMVTLNHWVSQGCMPEIRRRLGYRLELKEAIIPQSVKRGSALNTVITLRNTGFASLYNLRPVYLVLLGPSKTELILSSIDPRRWFTGIDHTISANVTIPANLPGGTYKLGLWLPDESTTLKNNPLYSVRFANVNVWDQTSGVNILTNNFTVTQ